MSVKIKLKHSSIVDKAPQPSDLDNGELALNTNAASPAAYIKDSAGNIVKLAGAGAIGGTDATTKPQKALFSLLMQRQSQRALLAWLLMQRS